MKDKLIEIMRSTKDPEDYYDSIAEYLSAELIETHINERVLAFLTHLCDTQVIDLHTPEQLLELFQQNNFGE